jgi:type III restriction enzyme
LLTRKNITFTFSLKIMSNEVQNPIINSPFVELKLHWLIKHGKSPVKAEGRRPASYYYRVPESAGRGRKNKNQMTLQGDLEVGELEDLPIVNWLRSRIKEWRVGALTGIPYDGASPVTKELLALWSAGSDRRQQRLFLAQLEAAETIIFLVEATAVYQKNKPMVPLDKPGGETLKCRFLIS